MIILGQCNDVAFACYLQAAAARHLWKGLRGELLTIQRHFNAAQNETFSHLNVGTFKFRLQDSTATVASNVEAISVRISDENVSSVWNVDSIREARDFLWANAALELTSFAEDCNAMSFEIANVEVVTYNKPNIQLIQFFSMDPDNLPLIAISEGSRMWSLQSNQWTKSPSSEMMKTVGETLSTATMCPAFVTARPATMSMYRMAIFLM